MNQMIIKWLQETSVYEISQKINLLHIIITFRVETVVGKSSPLADSMKSVVLHCNNLTDDLVVIYNNSELDGTICLIRVNLMELLFNHIFHT